jgi:hypothetical protein
MGIVTCEPIRSPAEADPHVVCCRAYEPPATSLVPPVLGSAVCAEMYVAAAATPFTASFKPLLLNVTPAYLSEIAHHWLFAGDLRHVRVVAVQQSILG